MKTVLPVEPGRVVRSKAGRDEGRYFIVLSLDGEEFAYVADGDLRKVSRPKRKRVKHLFVMQEMVSSLQKKLAAGERVEDYELRQSLAAFKQKEG